MKKLLFSIFFLLAFSIATEAQTLAWAAQFGGTNYAAGKAICTDASGNVYSTGYFYGTSDFDPSLGTLNFTSSSPSDQDVYISKLSVGANLMWAKQIGGSDNDYVFGMAVDQTTGDVYITGWFSDTVDFDPGAGSFIVASPGVQALYVLKLDAAGDFVWVKTLSGGVGSYGYALAFDLNGNIYVAGEFDGTIDFDPGAGIQNATAFANSDAFILKLDASGNYLMDIEFGGTGYDEIFDIAVDDLGNIYATGGYDGTIDLDPGTGTAGYPSSGYDIFISKFDAGGNLVWGKHMGGSGDEIANSIAVDTDGNTYLTGDFRGTVNFHTGAGLTMYTADGFSDGFIAKLDTAGILWWAIAISGPGLDEGCDLSLDAAGYVYCTGGFQDTIDFDPGAGVNNLYNAVGTDIYIAKFNSSAGLEWAKNMGGNGTDWGYAMALDANGDVYLTGQFTDTCDFDPNAGTAELMSLGQNDIYVMKLDLPTGVAETLESKNGISVYPNPVNSLLQIKVERSTTISIANVFGQEIMSRSIQSSESIDVTNLDAGIYFVKDLNSGEAVKFMKQ